MSCVQKVSYVQKDQDMHDEENIVTTRPVAEKKKQKTRFAKTKQPKTQRHKERKIKGKRHARKSKSHPKSLHQRLSRKNIEIENMMYDYDDYYDDYSDDYYDDYSDVSYDDYEYHAYNCFWAWPVLQ